MKTEKTLLSVTPSMFRNRPISFLLHVAFIVIGLVLLFGDDWIRRRWSLQIDSSVLRGIGMVVLVVTGFKFGLWWIKSVTTRLIVTTNNVARHEGLISRHNVKMRHANIQNHYVKQSVFQRIMGCGAVGFSSSGQAGVEIVVDGIPHPNRVAERIQQILDSSDSAKT